MSRPRPRHRKTGTMTTRSYKDMMAESRAYARAGAGHLHADLGEEICKDYERTMGEKMMSAAMSSRKKKSQPEPEAQSAPPPKEEPRVPPVALSDDCPKPDEDKGQRYGNLFKHRYLEEGLRSIYDDKATWVKMTFPSLEEAIFFSMTREDCIMSLYKSFGKVVVSPSRCCVISPPGTLRPFSNEYTAWVVGKVVIHSDRDGFLGPINPENIRGINISRSQLGWSICNTCAFSYGHLGPYCINRPAHHLQSLGDYARYEAYRKALDDNKGVMTKEIQKMKDILTKEKPRDKMTTPFISKKADSCIHKQTALWHEPLADFYHQMEFDKYNVLHHGVKKPSSRRFRDYAYRESLYGFRDGKGRDETLEENSSYITKIYDLGLDWRQVEEYKLPPFDPFPLH